MRLLKCCHISFKLILLYQLPVLNALKFDIKHNYLVFLLLLPFSMFEIRIQIFNTRPLNTTTWTWFRRLFQNALPDLIPNPSLIVARRQRGLWHGQYMAFLTGDVSILNWNGVLESLNNKLRPPWEQTRKPILENSLSHIFSISMQPLWYCFVTLWDWSGVGLMGGGMYVIS